MVLPAVEYTNESLNWCFAAERGTVNDVAILSHNNLNFGESSLPLAYNFVTRAAV